MLLSVLRTLVRREVLVAYHQRQELCNPLFFFIAVMILFPLGVTPERAFLATAASGVVWVSALLASMLSLERLFQSDYDDGSLEQLVLSPQPLYLLALAKVSVHWLCTGLPLILLSPLLALMMQMEAGHIPVLMMTLLLGTPVISLIGAIGAALTVSLRGSGILIALLVLPLTIPVLIFGTGAVQAAVDGLSIRGHLALLGAMLAATLTLAPFAIAAAMKMSVSNG
jgi:heme exporter protein B